MIVGILLRKSQLWRFGILPYGFEILTIGIPKHFFPKSRLAQILNCPDRAYRRANIEAKLAQPGRFFEADSSQILRILNNLGPEES